MRPLPECMLLQQSTNQVGLMEDRQAACLQLAMLAVHQHVHF